MRKKRYTKQIFTCCTTMALLLFMTSVQAKDSPDFTNTATQNTAAKPVHKPKPVLSAVEEQNSLEDIREPLPIESISESTAENTTPLIAENSMQRINRNPFGSSASDGAKPGTHDRILSSCRLLGIIKVGRESIALLSVTAEKIGTQGGGQERLQRLHLGEQVRLMLDNREQLLTLRSMDFRSIVVVDQYKQEYTLWL